MPLTKLQFKPGINREITKYSNEGGWVTAIGLTPNDRALVIGGGGGIAATTDFM